MYIDNSIITLLGIFSLKNDEFKTSYKELQKILPLEKSHISQSLAINERRKYIHKPEGKKYFTTIQITPNGMRQAERHVEFLRKLLNGVNSSPKQTIIANTPPSPLRQVEEFKSVIPEKLYSPLKRTIKNSLQDYIPETHITDELLGNLTDDIINFLEANSFI